MLNFSRYTHTWCVPDGLNSIHIRRMDGRTDGRIDVRMDWTQSISDDLVDCHLCHSTTSYHVVIFVFLTIIQYRVLEHVASMYAAALAQTDRSLHHHHGYSRCHTDMDIHPSTEKMMHQGLSGFIQKLKELFNIIVWILVSGAKISNCYW